MTAEILRLAALAAQTEVTRLAQLATQSADSLAAAEARAEKAEAALKRAKAQLKRAPVVQPELIAAARALLQKLDDITTEQFALGAERDEREALRALVEESEEA